MMQVIRLNDWEWWVGASVEEVTTAYLEEGGDESYLDDPHPEPEEKMQSLTYVDYDEERRSFAEQLEIEVANGGDFPRMFACTED